MTAPCEHIVHEAAQRKDIHFSGDTKIVAVLLLLALTIFRTAQHTKTRKLSDL